MCSKYGTVTLIELVESRPRLWEKTCEEFKDREMKASFGLKCCAGSPTHYLCNSMLRPLRESPLARNWFS